MFETLKPPTPHPPPPFSRQKLVSLSPSSCASLVELTDGRGGGERVESNHTTARKAWSSINHSILSGLAYSFVKEKIPESISALKIYL
jgi:hypothetical protein